jgi:lysophospholipase L1-like esterase
VPPNTTVLFQGDSITEAGRDHTRDNNLGTRYAMMVANYFATEFAEKKVRFLNRGVAADKIRDLKNRWQKDCIDLEPDIVSILVGINDVVGGHFWKSPTSTKSFEEDYRAILEQTQDVSKAKIVLVNPFMVFMTKQQVIYKIILNQKIDVVKKLSEEFKTLLVPLDKIFDEATRGKKPTYYSEDGIHPTTTGHSLIAESWIKSVNGRFNAPVNSPADAVE